MLGVLRAALDSAATIATSAAPRLAATADALPPPGTGAAEPSASTNPSRVRSRKRAAGVGSTHRLYGCGCELRVRQSAVRERSGSRASAHAAVRRDVGAGAGAVPARPPRDRRCAAARGRACARGRRSVTPGPERRFVSAVRPRGADLVVEAGDRPAPRAVLVGQRQARLRRLDLEQRPRAGDDRIGGGLLADGGEVGDREALVAPGDLAGSAAEPSVRTWTWTGSTRMNAIVTAPFRGRDAGSCRPGHSSDRTSVRLRPTPRPNRCSMSSVVGRNSSRSVSPWLSRSASPLAVTAASPARSGTPARPPVERVARVALERRRQARPDQPRPGHRPLAVAAPQRVGRLDRRAAGADRPPSNRPSCSRSPRFEAVTPSSRTRIPRTSGRASSSAAA